MGVGWNGGGGVPILGVEVVLMMCSSSLVKAVECGAHSVCRGSINDV